MGKNTQKNNNGVVTHKTNNDFKNNKKHDWKEIISIIISGASLIATLYIGCQTNSISNTSLEYNKRMDTLIYETGWVNGEFEYTFSEGNNVIKRLNSQKMAISILQGGIQEIYSIACNKKTIKYITPADPHIIMQTSDKMGISVEWSENFTDMHNDKVYDYIFVYLKDNSGKSYLTTFYVLCDINNLENAENNNPHEIDEIEMLKYIQDKEILDPGMKQIVEDYEFIQNLLKDYR